MEADYLLNWVPAVRRNSTLNDGLLMHFIAITILKLFSHF